MNLQKPHYLITKKVLNVIHYTPVKQPQHCENISEVRNEIDTIDRDILTLLGTRFKYVKEIVRFKEKTKESIIASDRREQVINQRRQWAVENGIDPDVIETMYRNLITYFIAEEMKEINI